MKKNILVFAETNEGKIEEIGLELLSKAGLLANKLGVEVDAIVLGEVAEKEIWSLGHYGCDRVFSYPDPRLNSFTSAPYAKAITHTIEKYRPSIVLFGATSTGRDVAPRVASALRSGLTADCTKLEIGDCMLRGREYRDILLQIRPAFGGNIIATIVSPNSVPSLSTVREGVMKIGKPDLKHLPRIIREENILNQEDFLSEVIKEVKKEKSVNLKNAKIIVAAGMGAANVESIALIKCLAKTLGGEVAASRPVVDANFLAKDHQVGQTGTTVRPNLYIACGISGQIQHLVGIGQSKRIIAINSDPQAPIFKIAHYGIVGDVKDVLEKMLAAYKGGD